jgi:two-component system, cell cycle response regulator
MPARILIIEDNAANMELMTYLVKAFGHATSGVETGEEGIDAMRRDKPDLVICDIQLPGIDGCAVARQLKADPALAAIPLVAVTSLAMVGDREKMMAAGFDGYVSKPIDPERFIKEMEEFLPPGLRSNGVVS